ncbi:MAG TPA: S8 family serine peptidase [Candidatus Angelobacter sp.]|jgi:subtilisin family serine protease|nr:S8 family serine peptidase [Candidatus Udaeobacter sp.]
MADDQEDQQTIDDTSAAVVNVTDQLANDPGMPTNATDENPSVPESARYEPGLIEVQLNDPVIPTISGLTLDSSSADMGAFNQALEELQAQEVIYTFRNAEADTAATEDLGGLPDLRNFLTIRVADDADVLAGANRLRQVAEVTMAMPIPLSAPPAAAPPPPMVGDPLTGTSDQLVTDPKTGLDNQWYIFRCKLDQAWLQNDGTGVIIVDIDWGFSTTHQDLRQNIDSAHTYNAYDGSANVSQGAVIYHGTAVTGLAAATMNNVGMCGAAVNATTWPVQANTGGTALPGNAWANAIEWASTQKTDGQRMVIIVEDQTGNFGNIEQVVSVNAAIKRAIARNVIVVVPAGNGNRDVTIADDGVTPIPPTGSILVGATTYDPSRNPRWQWSNYGWPMTVSAPGDKLHDLTCAPTNDSAYTNTFGGTSGAAPKVAGTVALMLGVNPKLTHQQVRDILFLGPDVVDTDVSKPVGSFLNAKYAVDEAARMAATP